MCVEIHHLDFSRMYNLEYFALGLHTDILSWIEYILPCALVSQAPLLPLLHLCGPGNRQRIEENQLMLLHKHNFRAQMACLQLTFMPGRPGCPGVPGGQEFGHWTTSSQKLFIHTPKHVTHLLKEENSFTRSALPIIPAAPWNWENI